MTRRWGWVWAGIVVALSTTLAYGVYDRLRFRRFFVVDPGKVYRSGQLGVDDWPVLQRRYHIRTVINLRRPGEDDATMAQEKQAVERLGMRFVNVALNVHNRPTTDQARQLLDLMTDPANQPVLIHCKHGKDRTGGVAALYRVMVQGWTVERAAAEMVGIHGKPMPATERFLRQYSSTPATSQPATN